MESNVLGLTELVASPYLALKKYGVTIMESAIIIDDKAYDRIMKFVDERSKNLEPSFTNLTVANNPKFIAKGKPNRFDMSIPCDDDKFCAWNNIEK